MRWIIAICFLWAMPVQANVLVTFRDGNPYDRFYIQNTGCQALVGVLTIDLTTADKSVLIDTLRGGPGTKDPMPVDIELGPISVAPVQDDDQIMVVLLENLPPGHMGIVTFDLDGNAGWWPAPNVSVDPHELRGATAHLETKNMNLKATFGTDAAAQLGRALGECSVPDAPQRQNDPLIG